MKIPVGVSNRHIHLTRETYYQLFGHTDLQKLRDLNQEGEFVTTSTLIIKTENNQLENVRILGPFRSYDQVEISKTDSYKLKINPPVRKSGNLVDASLITLVGPMGEVTKNIVIIANRHIHMSSDMANKLNLIEDQEVDIVINTIKKGLIKAFVKITLNGYLEIHLDQDDANAFLLTNNDNVELITK